MSDVFVLRNQSGAFLNKSHEWVSAGDSKTLFRSVRKDDVINEKVELTVKQPELRIQVVVAQQADNGRIFIDDVDCLPKAESTETDGELMSANDADCKIV